MHEWAFSEEKLETCSCRKFVIVDLLLAQPELMKTNRVFRGQQHTLLDSAERAADVLTLRILHTIDVICKILFLQFLTDFRSDLGIGCTSGLAAGVCFTQAKTLNSGK